MFRRILILLWDKWINLLSEKKQARNKYKAIQLVPWRTMGNTSIFSIRNKERLNFARREFILGLNVIASSQTVTAQYTRSTLVWEPTCLIALMNISLFLKTDPEFSRIESSKWRERTLDLSSCDLQKQTNPRPVWEITSVAARRKFQVESAEQCDNYCTSLHPKMTNQRATKVKNQICSHYFARQSWRTNDSSSFADTNLGSGGPSANSFMLSLQKLLMNK